MRISLFGSTGRVGKEFLKRSLADGNSVKALVRSPEKLDEIKDSRLTVIKGNALHTDDIEKTLSDTDLVISCLNTDGDNTLSVSAEKIISSMKTVGHTRILTVGTAGILQSRHEPELFRFQSSESKRRSTRAAEEHLKVYQLLVQSDLDWMIACPTYLPDGDFTGNYRYEADQLPENGKSISVSDTAHFLYQELQQHHFSKKRVGLAY